MTALDDAWSAVHVILDKWRTKGVKRQRNGTELICPVPHIAPQAWLHEVYASISVDRLRSLTVLGRPLSRELREFYALANGFYLFSGSFILYGFIEQMSRTPDLRQPFSLIDHNSPAQHPRQRPPDVLLVGSLVMDGDDELILGALPNGIIVGLDRTLGAERTSWGSLNALLVGEIERVASRFDEEGRQK